MRYHRVLMALALIGVIGLAATLVTDGRSAAKSVRPAAGTPTLQSALRQEVWQMLAKPQLSNIQPSAPVMPGGQTCFVDGGCSLHPCVIPVQSQPAVATVGSLTVAPGARPVRPSASSCPPGSINPPASAVPVSAPRVVAVTRP